MGKVINCRFMSDNFFVGRNSGTFKAICIDTNDTELIGEIKNILTRKAYSILDKGNRGEDVNYSELTNTCQAIEQIDNSIKEFEEFKEEQGDESCTVTN